jgi:hypothetical protein
MSDKSNKKASSADDDMLPEYDLSNRTGERGRYYDALQQGYAVHIHENDGTTTIQHYKLEEGVVLLDPDVREYFPDAKSVNAALRSLIALIPSQRVRRRSSSTSAESPK